MEELCTYKRAHYDRLSSEKVNPHIFRLGRILKSLLRKVLSCKFADFVFGTSNVYIYTILDSVASFDDNVEELVPISGFEAT